MALHLPEARQPLDGGVGMRKLFGVHLNPDPTGPPLLGLSASPPLSNAHRSLLLPPSSSMQVGLEVINTEGHAMGLAQLVVLTEGDGYMRNCWGHFQSPPQRPDLRTYFFKMPRPASSNASGTFHGSA